MKIGTTDISSVKLGSITVNKVYIGATEIWPNFAYLLDIYSGAAVGCSLRLLSSTYTGDAIQVRRDSDNSTLDIGFIDNVLDTASLITFCTGTNGFITIWYDQSGNNRNVTQGTIARQPKIYDSVTGVYILNSKPAVFWSGAGSSIRVSLSYANLPASVSYSISSVISTIDNGGDYVRLLAIGPDSATEGVWYALNTGTTLAEWVQKDTGAMGDGYNDTTSPTVISNGRIMNDDITEQVLLTTVLSSSNAKMFRNGSEISYRVQRTGDCYNSVGNLIIGNQPNNINGLTGLVQEMIIWQSDEDANLSGIETNTNDFYTIY